jgi:hypothetical protein
VLSYLYARFIYTYNLLILSLFNILFYKVNKRLDNLKKTFNKTLVEIKETKESLNVFNYKRRLLIKDTLNFYKIYFNTKGKDNYP